MKQENYLVYGATGAQGSAVVSALRAGGKNVRVLLRNTDNKSLFEGHGVEVAFGDLDSPAQLLAASRDVAGIYFALPLQFNAYKATLWGRNAIDAAVAAEAPLIVFNTSNISLMVNNPFLSRRIINVGINADVSCTIRVIIIIKDITNKAKPGLYFRPGNTRPHIETIPVFILTV